jgi:hypothetical protein
VCNLEYSGEVRGTLEVSELEIFSFGSSRNFII